MEEYTWNANPIQRDPLTERMICFSCWHNMHSCKNAKCHCLCKELEADSHAIRQHDRQVRREAKKIQDETLEASPLKADNTLIERKANLEKFIAEKFGLKIGVVKKLGLIRLASLDPEIRKNLLNEAVDNARRKINGQQLESNGRKTRR